MCFRQHVCISVLLSLSSSRRLYPGVSRADDRGCGVRLVRGGRDNDRHAVLEGRRGELPPEGQTRRNRRRTLPSAG